MRPTPQLLASLSKRSAAYLTPGAPTGLTGVLTHPSPRPHLLYLYNRTLDQLATLPSSSIYRQSTEALTRHRLAIVAAQVPAGFDAWQARVQAQIDANPKRFAGSETDLTEHTTRGQRFVTQEKRTFADARLVEWDGEIGGDRGEGPKLMGQKVKFGEGSGVSQDPDEMHAAEFELEKEPQLTADQVATMENEIAAGLIEEVIAVAEGELTLVETMRKDAVWDELVEKPVEGQWSYAQRDTNVGTTQGPA